ncbi:cytochrome C oxidase subunit IV family protein [Flavobacterium ardleyense]|uniref:Cytochrome C oxidase subunit IV family protein n=1 Tax=Flavobacterium ardleyense TaxID=2038737 RepID=A0ABW5Z557_9FLAO
MKLKLTSTFIVLILLTLVSVFFAFNISSELIVAIVVCLSLLKFYLVAFQFMELKNANVFWKVLLLAYGAFMGLVLIILL